MRTLRVGVLGYQGDIEEHLSALDQVFTKLGISGEALRIKYFEGEGPLDGLIIPGGESTVMGELSAFRGTLKSIREMVSNGKPIMGTCAGLIMLASKTYDRVVGETNQPLLGVLDILVERNAFGRQRESFEADLQIPILGKETFRGIFIRPPLVKEAYGGVEVLTRLNDGIVAVRQGNIIGTCFHPELANDTRLHEHFVRSIEEAARESP